MPYWLVNLIVAILMLLIFITILGVMAMLFSYRLTVEKEKNKQLEKENTHKQQLLDAYGIKEINIEREERIYE